MQEYEFRPFDLSNSKLTIESLKRERQEVLSKQTPFGQCKIAVLSSRLRQPGDPRDRANHTQQAFAPTARFDQSLALSSTESFEYPEANEIKDKYKERKRHRIKEESSDGVSNALSFRMQKKEMATNTPGCIEATKSIGVW